MNQQTQSKGGWIASFMIIGAVLVLVLLAGLYYLKSRQIEEGSARPVATETEKPQEDKTPEAKEPTSDTKQETDAKKDEKQQAPATSDKTTEEQPQKEAASAENDKKESHPTVTKSENLPETGPADAGAQFVAVVALTISSVAYVQSRRGL